jgi:hypothetical protein
MGFTDVYNWEIPSVTSWFRLTRALLCGRDCVGVCICTNPDLGHSYSYTLTVELGGYHTPDNLAGMLLDLL